MKNLQQPKITFKSITRKREENVPLTSGILDFLYLGTGQVYPGETNRAFNHRPARKGFTTEARHIVVRIGGITILIGVLLTAHFFVLVAAGRAVSAGCF